MDKWKSFFQSSGSDIWTVIDRAITLAAVEHPAEMRMRRDKYTEKMFCPTAHLTSLCGCDEDGKEERRSDDEESEDDVSETKFVLAPVTVDRDEDEEEDVEEDEEDEDDRTRRRRRIELSDDEEEEEEEEEGDVRQIREVNRVKTRISNADEDDEYLSEALEGLERMQISFQTLKATAIGKPVNNLRKHPSSKVRAIAQRLISRWKALTEQWTNSAKHLSSDPVSSQFDNNDDDYGLPSPPVDEGELLAAGSAPVDTKLLEFFEDEMSAGSGMNEQPRRGSSGDWVNGIYEEAHSPDNNITSNKASRKVTDSDMDRRNKPPVSRKDTVKSSESLRGKSGEGSRLEKPSSRANGKSTDDLKDSRKTGITSSSRPKPPTPGAASARAPPPKPKPANANGFQRASDEKPQSSAKLSQAKTEGLSTERLAAAKRKLNEGYRQAENAKKQRTVQVMELTDLPKGKGGPKAVKAGPTKSHIQHNNRYRR